MPAGAVPLSDYPNEIVVLACDRCDKRWEYQRSNLIKSRGPDIGLPTLRVALVNCSLIHNRAGNDTCAAVYPDLMRPMLAPQRRGKD
jgi:hypothetical protein